MVDNREKLKENPKCNLKSRKYFDKIPFRQSSSTKLAYPMSSGTYYRALKVSTK